MTTVRDRVTVLDTALTELTERLQQATQRAERLEQQLADTTRRLARGSVAPPVVVDRGDLAARLERLLRERPQSTAEASQALGVPVAHVANALRALRRERRIYNAGTNTAPLWTWVIGDETETAELMVEVEKLLRLREWPLMELVAATGARHNRISGVIVRLAKAGIPIVNRGNRYRARWTIAKPSDRVATRVARRRG